MSKTSKMPHVHIRLFASCLWCEKEIPLIQNMQAKLICSKRCLKEINQKINDPKFFYDIDDVVKRNA